MVQYPMTLNLTHSTRPSLIHCGMRKQLWIVHPNLSNTPDPQTEDEERGLYFFVELMNGRGMNGHLLNVAVDIPATACEPGDTDV